MERRVLIAIFLSFIVLYAYQAFFVKPAPKPGAAGAQTQSSKTEPPNVAKPAAPAAAVPASAPAAAPLVADSQEKDTVVETRDVIAVITNRGARLKSWRLKKYLDQQDRKPQELIENKLPTQPLPMTLSTSDAQLMRR